jgi:hypothetical protein
MARFGRRWWIAGLEGSVVFAFAAYFFFYPAYATLSTALSSQVRAAARPPGYVEAFRATSSRYRDWAKHYLASRRAAEVAHDDVAATEWPIFGSVFFLLATEQLLEEGALKADDSTRDGLRLAAEVVAHPATATWVRAKWGERYLESENVFYRMLLLLGLSSYRDSSGDDRYDWLLRSQTEALRKELLARPLHLADDYPGECYPTDVLWAVAALGRSGDATGEPQLKQLTQGLLHTLNHASTTPVGLPAFRVDAHTGAPQQPARGSGNSGILVMAAALDVDTARAWFESYVRHYWDSGWLLSGFREFPRGDAGFSDVDSGPVIAGVGSVASVFAIGAARSLGRYDYAAPLVMESVAASWPTPSGLLLPGVMGWSAADGWCFGELALHFAVTRPNQTQTAVRYEGPVPGVVWLFLAFYLIAGAGLSYLGARRLWPAASHAPRT